MSDARPYAFVSYASENRDRVLAAVDRLRDGGVQVWIDKDRIVGGANFTTEIQKGVIHASAVIIFTSAAAFESNYVGNEVGLAFRRNKPLIPVRLDGADPTVDSSILLFLDGLHFIDARNAADDGWLSDLHKALKPHGVQGDDGVASERRPEWPRPVTPQSFACSHLVPYLVDRARQHRALRDALDRHFERRPRRPIALVGYARKEQAIYAYAERLEKEALPRQLKRHNHEDKLAWKNIGWMGIDGWHANRADTVRLLIEDFSESMDVPLGGWPDRLPHVLGNRREATVCASHLTWDDWSEEHVATIRMWIEEWKGLPALPPRCPLFLVILIEYAESSNRWTKISSLANRFGFSGRAAASMPHPIHEQLQSLGTLEDDALSVCLLPELGNVTIDHITQWITDEVKPIDAPAMIRQARKLVKDLRLDDVNGVPMNEIVDQLRALLEEFGRAS